MDFSKRSSLIVIPETNLDSKLQDLSVEEFAEQKTSSRETGYLLVVNGSDLTNDDITMGDWLGFCSIFVSGGSYGGDFWTAVHPDQYLHATGHPNVKFGRSKKNKKTGEIEEDVFGGTPVYTLGDGPSMIPFKVIDKTLLKSHVLGWIEEKGKLAKFGDTVTIILSGHGNRAKRGAFRLGTNFLFPDEYAEAIKAFKPDVQVNTIYNGCYSGFFHDAIVVAHEKRQRRFVHVAATKNEVSAGDTLSPSRRYRQTPFARAWVKSLTGTTMKPGKRVIKSPSGKTKYRFTDQDLTIEGHRDRTLAATSQRHHMENASHAQLFFSEQHLHLTNQLSKVLFRKYVDIGYDPLKDSLRRRLDSHAQKLIQKAASKTINPSKECVKAAMYLCDRENQAIETSPLPTEVALWSASSNEERRQRNLPYLLLNLYWRARKQIAIFEVFCQLYDMDNVSAEALAVPILYSRIPDMTGTVLEMLACFRKLNDLSEPPQFEGTHIHEFEAATHWFAAMICRSCVDLDELNDLISLIDYSRKLGRLDDMALQKIDDQHNEAARKALLVSKGKGKGKGKEKEIQVAPLFEGDEMENAAEKRNQRVFGLILPDGKGSDIHQLFDDANTRFVEIENVFKTFFDMTDKELALIDDEWP